MSSAGFLYCNKIVYLSYSDLQLRRSVKRIKWKYKRDSILRQFQAVEQTGVSFTG